MSVRGLEELLANIEAKKRHILQAKMDAAQEIAAYLETYAKANHRWGNPYSEGYTPTGMLEASIHGDVVDVSEELITICLHADMNYAAPLELASKFKGKYAWMRPAVENNQQTIIDILRRHLEQ
jgi:hypothetical protein